MITLTLLVMAVATLLVQMAIIGNMCGVYVCSMVIVAYFGALFCYSFKAHEFKKPNRWKQNPTIVRAGSVFSILIVITLACNNVVMFTEYLYHDSAAIMFIKKIDHNLFFWGIFTALFYMRTVCIYAAKGRRPDNIVMNNSLVNKGE